MKLKKVILALGLGACIMMTGCGSTQAANNSGGGSSSEGKEIQAIKDRGVLKVGVKVDVPKYGYKNPTTGQMEGFEIDLSRAVAKKILGDEKITNIRGVGYRFNN